MVVNKKTNNSRADRGKNRKNGNVKLSPEEIKTNLAKQYGIKPKTKEFIDLLNSDSKLSATEAYIRTHKTESRITAGNAANKLLKKPSVIGYSQSAVGKAKRRIIELVDSTNESIAVKASQDILDRNEGKAIQKTENLSRVVNVKLDLTGVRIGTHYLQDGE
jgi:hypothetical protein